MKKNILISVIFFALSNAWSFTGNTISDTLVYDTEDYSSIPIQKGKTVTFEDILVQYKKLEGSESKPYLKVYAEGKNRNIEGWISLLDIEVNGIKVPDAIKNYQWSPLYEVEVLFSQDRNIVEENNIFYNRYNQWKEYTDFQNDSWYDSYFSPEFVITNGIVYLTDTFAFGGRTAGIINKFDSEKSEIEWTCTKSNSSSYENIKDLPSAYAKRFKENETYVFKYELDGDYMTVFLEGKAFERFVHLDSNTRDEIRIFIYQYYNEEFDLNKVKWPRHSDGECDYDSCKNEKAAQSYPGQF